MNLPEGFKQTEVGVIPKDWNVSQLKKVSLYIGSGKSKTTNEDGDFPIYGSTGIIGYRKEYDYSGEKILVARVGANAGKVNKVNGKYCISDNALLVNLDKSISFEYIAYFLIYIKLNQMIFGSGQPLITGGQLKKIIIPLPPTRAEQTAIAAALSNMDALIEGVEKLLEKKRRIKQGAMQELLTGKKRVSGFESKKGFQQTEVGVIPQDWGLTSLMEHIAALDAGVSVNSVDEKLSVLGHSESVLKTSCVYNGYFYPEECKKILPKDVSRAKLTPKKNSIIISRMNTPTLVGECGFIANDYPSLFLPDRLWQTSFKNDADINARWLAYILSFGEISKSIKEIATGTSDTMKNIAKNALLKVKIPYPTKSEQTSIAAILSDMDAEIEQFETQLTKYRQLKTGMMQELLTGKKRLL